MSLVNIQYKNNLRKYGKRDGVNALAVYCLVMGSAFFQGWLYTTNVNVFVMNLLQILIPVVLAAGFFCFFYYCKESIISIGINADHIWNSILLGFAGGFLLLAIQTTLFTVQGKSVSFVSPQLLNLVIFLFAAFEEEVLFRGYIQTRLSGLINNHWIVGIINSVLFYLYIIL